MPARRWLADAELDQAGLFVEAFGDSRAEDVHDGLHLWFPECAVREAAIMRW